MANPQLEDGHLRIANDIWDALCRIRIPGEVRQVIDTVLRKTWGFQKKQDHIAISQFQAATGINRGNVCRALRKAITMNIIVKKDDPLVKKDDPRGVSYSFNKDYETWRGVSSKKTRSSKKTPVVVKKDDKTLSKKTTTKDNKDILKDNSAPSAPLSLKTKKKPDPRMTVFRDYWMEEYRKIFPGEKYLHKGAKDAVATKTLLGSAELKDIQDAASWFLRYDGNDWLGQQPKEINRLSMNYNDIRQRMLAEKGRYNRPPE